jgi:hypothetical protein
MSAEALWRRGGVAGSLMHRECILASLLRSIMGSSMLCHDHSFEERKKIKDNSFVLMILYYLGNISAFSNG